MKQKVRIQNGEDVIYNGKLQDLPFKKDYIINRSIELFDDDDPCIIHQSYVVKDYADKLLDLLDINIITKMSENLTVFSSLNFDDIDKLTIELLG